MKLLAREVRIALTCGSERALGAGGSEGRDPDLQGTVSGGKGQAGSQGAVCRWPESARLGPL